MRTLARLSFEYMWLLLFADEEIIDMDYAVKMQEGLSEYFAAMSSEEKDALRQVASETRDRLMADPDEYGYSPRKLVTAEHQQFLDDLIAGDLF